jgi:hypothetical protein
MNFTGVIGRVAGGAGVAYLSHMNPYAGAAIGGISVLADEMAKFVIPKIEAILNRTLSGVTGDVLCQFCSTFTSFYTLEAPRITPYTGRALNFHTIFFLDWFSRLTGQVVSGKVKVFH